VHFGPNQVLQQGMVIQQAAKDSEGEFMLKLLDTIPAPIEIYAKDCKMN
jgi:hypothetical protein